MILAQNWPKTAKSSWHCSFKTQRIELCIDDVNRVSVVYYIITQIILALWLVLAYDLVENRRSIDVIITEFFPLCFKMAESFENFDVLRD